MVRWKPWRMDRSIILRGEARAGKRSNLEKICDMRDMQVQQGLGIG